MSIKHKGQRWIVEVVPCARHYCIGLILTRDLKLGAEKGTLVPTLSSQKLVHGSVGIVPGAVACGWSHG